MTIPPFIIFENKKEGWLSPAKYPDPRQGHNVSQPPVITSWEEYELFIGDLRQAALRVFGPEPIRPWPVEDAPEELKGRVISSMSDAEVRREAEHRRQSNQRAGSGSGYDG